MAFQGPQDRPEPLQEVLHDDAVGIAKVALQLPEGLVQRVLDALLLLRRVDGSGFGTT
jgi:hypothetical protein